MEVACSGRAPPVTMTQPTHLGDRDDPPRIRRLDRSRLPAVLVQHQMRPAAVIVANEVLNVSVQAALVEPDHVIQALAPQLKRRTTPKPRGASMSRATYTPLPLPSLRRTFAPSSVAGLLRPLLTSAARHTKQRRLPLVAGGAVDTKFGWVE